MSRMSLNCFLKSCYCTAWRRFRGNKNMFSSILPLCFIRPLPLVGGPGPPVRPPGPVLGSLHGRPPLRLHAGLEGAGHHAHQPGTDVHFQSQPGPLQVGRQQQGGRGGRRRRRRVGVRGRHQPEQGGGEARGRHGVSAAPGGVEGLQDGSVTV